jgi:Protein of unknown function (DUF3592)
MAGRWRSDHLSAGAARECLLWVETRRHQNGPAISAYRLNRFLIILGWSAHELARRTAENRTSIRRPLDGKAAIDPVIARWRDQLTPCISPILHPGTAAWLVLSRTSFPVLSFGRQKSPIPILLNEGPASFTMNQRGMRARRGGRIVLVIGLLLLVPGVIALAHSLAFVMLAQRAEANFQGAVERNSSYGLMYYPRFTFRTKDGREMTFTSSVGTSDQEYGPGSKRVILYDPTHPDHMQSDSLFGVWLLPVVMLPPALLVTLIGSAILFL